MALKLVEELEMLGKAFESEDLVKLKKIGNESIEDAALRDDKQLAEVSLIAYSLSKLASKEHVVKSKKWKEVKSTILKSIVKALEDFKKNKLEDFKKNLEEISKDVSSIDENLGHYVINIYSKARLKQASRAYALGLSLSAAADLTDADKKQLQTYIGATKIHEGEISRLGISDRLKKVRKLFE